MTVMVDIARWWAGPEAVKAAVEHGFIRPGQALPNGYYIRNDSPMLRTLPLAPTVVVTVARCPTGCSTFGGTLDGLAAALAHPNPRATLADDYRPQSLYWLEIANGAVVRIDEQYLP